MGKRGPRPKDKPKVFTGEPVTELPCPAWLGPVGRAEFARASTELVTQGRLTSGCLPALEGLAGSYQLVMAAEEKIKEHGTVYDTDHGLARNPAVMVRSTASKEWQTWLQQLCLTPATIAKAPPVAKPAVDELEIFKVTG